MSQSGQPPYLKPEAFEAAPEIKEEKGSPYGVEVECIEKYPKTGTDAEKKPFQDQFNQLLDKYQDWGIKHDMYILNIDEQLRFLQNQLFSSYSDTQEPKYFENIKKNLEKIILLLNNDQISEDKRKIAYHDLCSHLGACAPGLYLHIENAYFSLSSNISLHYWLAKFRTDIIKDYAVKYNAQHDISTAYSIHTIKVFAEDAKDQGWNPAFSTDHVEDKYAPHITEKDRDDFHNYFVKTFNPTAIRHKIQTKLNAKMNKIFKTLEFTEDEWKYTNHPHYKAFTDQATNLLKNLGIKSKNDIFDFMESNDDFTQFRLCEDKIVDILCERVLSPALYFDPVNKIYHKLLPFQWIDHRYPLEMIDFSVWNTIPDERFSSILRRISKEIDIRHARHLLENIPYEKLTKINNNEDFVKTLSSIRDKDKQTYIPSPEEKHAFFQPSANKLLDKLLLHIAHGEQDQAEAILKINPELLFMSSNVEAPSGNIFMDYSPCRLACYAHDMDMLEMMKPYVYRVPHGEEQFTNLLKEASEAFKNQKTYNFAELADIINNGTDAQIKLALDNFRRQFEPKYIKNKKSFNIENFLKAYEIYINNFDTWSKEKRRLFWCQVIGYLQRSLPACYAQVIDETNGLIKITLGNKRQIRNALSFYPLVKNAHAGLGFDYAIYDGVKLRSHSLSKRLALSFKEDLEQYVKEKQERCEKLIEPYKEEKVVNHYPFFQTGKNKMLENLLSHIARGEQAQAEAIIKFNPKLLFQSGNVSDLIGNKFMDYSPVKLACFTHDADMLEMMKPYLGRVKDGEEQFTNILKEANQAYENQEVYDFGFLVAAFNSGNASQIEEALEKFRKDFEPRKIQDEKSFNMNNLLKAYDIHINTQQQWAVENKTIFWTQVIGYLQRSLPACYAQAICCTDFLSVMEGTKPLKRELKFDGRDPFYHRSGVVTEKEGLGFDFAIYFGFLGDNRSAYPCKGALIECQYGTPANLEKYATQKQQRLERLYKKNDDELAALAH